MERNEVFKLMGEYNKPRTATKLEIKKFNKNNQLCYYDSIDLTGKDFTEKQIELFSKLFVSAGFKVDVYNHTYFGIYDPSRIGELIELYPTDEELLKTELRWKK